MDINQMIFDDAVLYYADFNESSIDTIITSLAGKELGCSDAGLTFTSNLEIRDIPVAGSKERKIKGMQRIIKGDGSVEGEIKLLNADLLNMSLMKKDTTTSTKFDKYTYKTGVIEDACYKDLILIGSNADVDAIIVLRNTYNENGVGLVTKDKEEGTVKVKFSAHYDGIASKTVPVEIYIAKA